LITIIDRLVFMWTLALLYLMKPNVAIKGAEQRSCGASQ
jgi:hypothetical protein